MARATIWPSTDGQGSYAFAPITVATEFYVTQPGCFLSEVWYYRTNTTITPQNVLVYKVNSASSLTVVPGHTFVVPASSGTGWKGLGLPQPWLELEPNQHYRVAFYYQTGNIPGGPNGYFSTGPGGGGIVNGPLVCPGAATAIGGAQGSYGSGAGIVAPTTTDSAKNSYWASVAVEYTPATGQGEVEFTGGFGLHATGSTVPQGELAVTAGSVLALEGMSGTEAVLTAGSALSVQGVAVARGEVEFATRSALDAVGDTPLGEFPGQISLVEFLALTDDGTVLANLPDVRTWSLSPLLNDAGSVQLTYPTGGINFSLLRDNVTQDRDLNLAIAVHGIIQPQLQAVLLEASGDDVDPGAVWTFSGNFTEQWLTEAIVAPKAGQPSQGDDTDSENDAHFYSQTAGAIARTLLAEANQRGALTHVDWSTIGNDTDSTGATWSEIITLKLAPGQHLLTVLKALVEFGMCEFEMVGSQLRMYDKQTHAVDRTLGPDPLVFRAGRDLTDSPRSHSVRDTATSLLVAGGEGVYHDTADGTALARRGRRIEAFVSQGSLTDPGAVVAYAQTALQGLVAGTMEKTHGLVLDWGPQPLRDWTTGDWAWSALGDGLEKLRIKQLTLTGAETGTITGTVTLNDLIAEREAVLARRIAGIEGGTTVTGTSQARLRPEDVVDTVGPVAPQGVSVDSLAYDQGGVAFAAAFATWPAVLFNADGTSADDVAQYTLRWRYTDPAHWAYPGFPDLAWHWLAAPETDAQWSGLYVGEEIEVAVMAIDQSQNRSPWSPAVFHVLASDDTAPPVPSALATSTLFSSTRLGWDGLGSAGEPMPTDFDHLQVHASLQSGFTPTPGTEWTRMHGAGVTSYSAADYDVTVFFKAVAVDRSGNESAPSAQTSGTARRAVNVDLGPDAVDRINIVNSAIGSAEIDTAAINDLHVANVNVGKLTGGTLHGDVVLGANIATGLSGGRVGMNQDGFYAYNPAGANTVRIDNTGDMLMTGQWQTRPFGERFVANYGGVNPSELRYYPDTGGEYGSIFADTWVNPITNGDFALLRIHSAGEYKSGWDLWPQNSYWRLFHRTQRDSIDPAGSSYAYIRMSMDSANTYGYMHFGGNDFHFQPKTSSDNLGLGIRAGAPGHGAAYIGRGFGLGGGSGLLFGANGLYCHTGFYPGTYTNFYAANIAYASSQADKEQITDITETVLDAIDNVPAKRWRRRHEVEELGDAAPWYFGPMVEDVPAELALTGAAGDPMMDLGSEVGYVWDALRLTRRQARTRLAELREQATNQIQRLRGDITALEDRVAALDGGMAP